MRKEDCLYDVDAVMQTVLRDKAFYRQSGGGMTLSGGEPSAQPAFSLSLLRAARAAGIACAMESAGTGDASFYHAAMEIGCLFLYDIKHMDTGHTP